MSWCSCTRQRGRSCLKSKAAALVLFWNMFVLLAFQLFLEPNIFADNDFGNITTYKPSIMIYGFSALLLLLFPLAGFVADICFGRFKTLQCSLWNMWITPLVTLMICSIGIGILKASASPAVGLVIICTSAAVGGISLLVSYVSFSANVIQFGLDQLQNHPASDSSLFIYCYVWMYHLSVCLYKLAINLFLCSIFINDYYSDYALIIALGIVIFLGHTSLPITLCLIRHRRIRRWFMIEPGAQNPYKLVYKVLKFAAKHDHPIQRSAFTYCEDELPSRLDLGKSKYGGPFSTEEVENVKCFGGIVRVLLSLGLIFVVELAAREPLSNFYIHLVGHENMSNPYEYRIPNFVSCIFFIDTGTLSSAIIVILIPLYVYLLRPYLSCFTFGTLKRLGIAIVLYTISLLVPLITDTVGHNKLQNHNATCMFTSFRVTLSSINSNVVLIPIILNAFAIVLFYTAAFEFICSQSPQSMKGLIIGAFFAISGLFKFIGVTVFLVPFRYWSILDKNFPSCGFAYYVPNIIIAMIGFVTYTLVARGYHYRQRDEPSNVHRYVENYYENIQDEPGYDYDDLEEHEVYSVRPD